MKTLIKLSFIVAISLGLASGCKKKPQAHHAIKTNEPAAYPENAFEPKKKAPTKQPVKREIAPGTLRYLDAKNGFRDTKLGGSEKDIPNLVLKSSDDARGLKTYTRSDETLSFNGVPLKSVEYTFLKGELFQVVAKWSVEEKGAVLKNSGTTSLAPFCASLYGPARRHAAKKGSAEYVWRGKQVELILNEARLPGVPDAVHGGWAIAPSTKGEMLVESIGRRKALNAQMASTNGEKKDGL